MDVSELMKFIIGEGWGSQGLCGLCWVEKSRDEEKE
jgi:hypothetical protein